MFIPFAEFAPDQPVWEQKGSPYLVNIIPLTGHSYGPFAGFSSTTNAITARCQGFISVRAADGTIHIFAGDATKLRKLNSDGVTWDDVSRASGYTTGADQRWYFIQMGDRIVATNYADEIQTYVIGVSALFANLAAGAPKARFIAVIKGALVAADTWDATDGYKQNRVWWADFSDPTNWPTPGTAAAAAAQSDFQDIQFGGGINGLLGGVGGRDGVVFFQNAIVTMDYIGGGVVFSFTDAERGKGTNIPGSLVHVGPFAGYIGEDGFFLFDGARSTPIGAGRVNKFFWGGDRDGQVAEGVDQTNLVRISAAFDSKRHLVYWGYIDASSSTSMKFLIYNWAADRWAWAEHDSIDIIGQGFTAAYTLETLDNVNTSIDALPYSLDSQSWMGGRPQVAAFNSTFKFGYFNGSNLVAAAGTGEFGGDKRIFVRRIRPACDAPEANVDLRVEHRNNQNSTPTLTALTALGADGTAPFRIDARYVRCHISIDAGTTWHHALGVSIDYREGGPR